MTFLVHPKALAALLVLTVSTTSDSFASASPTRKLQLRGTTATTTTTPTTTTTTTNAPTTTTSTTTASTISTTTTTAACDPVVCPDGTTLTPALAPECVAYCSEHEEAFKDEACQCDECDEADYDFSGMELRQTMFYLDAWNVTEQLHDGSEILFRLEGGLALVLYEYEVFPMNGTTIDTSAGVLYSWIANEAKLYVSCPNKGNEDVCDVYVYTGELSCATSTTTTSAACATLTCPDDTTMTPDLENGACVAYCSDHEFNYKKKGSYCEEDEEYDFSAAGLVNTIPYSEAWAISEQIFDGLDDTKPDKKTDENTVNFDNDYDLYDLNVWALDGEHVDTSAGVVYVWYTTKRGELYVSCPTKGNDDECNVYNVKPGCV